MTMNEIALDLTEEVLNIFNDDKALKKQRIFVLIRDSLQQQKKEQDRDTRHRCAELAANAAMSACMNARMEE